MDPFPELPRPSASGRRDFLRRLAAGAATAAGASSAAALISATPRLLSATGLTDALRDAAPQGTRLQRPRPTPAQLAWQQDELALFVHFGINTFSNREWGDGTESPTDFTPSRLDARQWAASAKAAGAKAMILTAKHHDGFCLWPTQTTSHSVRSSLWKRGQGDVVGDFVNACRAEGLKAGLYCSPWDRNHKAYGDSPRYNDVYIAQLTELLTRYGDINEVWFDGANGEGPNGKRQVYDWPRTWALVRKLQPRAVIFSDAGPDVRWIGNERGVAGETNWSTIRPESVPFIGASGDGVIKALQEGHPDGSVWRPGETDVSIRPGWFYHPAEDRRVKSVDQLVDLYFTSVGRNSKLLLNVPPTRDGLFHDTDVANLSGMRAALDRLFANKAVPLSDDWRVTGPTSAQRTMRFQDPVDVAVVSLAEDVTQGQLVARWTLRDASTGASDAVIASGTTIGYRQLRKLNAARVSAVTLTVETLEAPIPVTVSLYR